MPQENINEDILLLLIENNGVVDISTIPIDNHFEQEAITLNQLCQGSNDNIQEITKFINSSLKPKLPTNKVFNYCKDLDKAFHSVRVNIELGIKTIMKDRDAIFAKQKIAIQERKDFNLKENFTSFKSQIEDKIYLWFKAFNIELAYVKAKKTQKMLVYSHKMSGWLNPEFKITGNLKQEIKTNFGYGSVSYFYSILTYKNIQITPFSEWIDYRFANFSEVIRYTRSFRTRIPVTDEYGKLRYYKTKIDSSYWYNAIAFTKNAANLSLSNEKEFVDKYIISECEKMVDGLENIYKETQFEFVDENQVAVENDKIIKLRVDFNGYELLDFRTEKIVGALDFLVKIIEYNSIIPTYNYKNRIVALNRKLIPNVYNALDNQKRELESATEDYNKFLKIRGQLIEKRNFYQIEKAKLKNLFEGKYKEEYSLFQDIFTKSNEELKHHYHKVKLHTYNINRLEIYIQKYNDLAKD